MFSPIIDSTNKNNKVILEVMEKIGDSQHEMKNIIPSHKITISSNICVISNL